MEDLLVSGFSHLGERRWCLKQGGSMGGGEKWLDAGHREHPRFSDRWDVE